jgi:flagellar motor protein MotB
VVGHTDDQRIRSLQYQNNDELSKAREASSRFCNARSTSPARLMATGMGSREPLDPKSTAESRARNRRVEIKHRSGT